MPLEYSMIEIFSSEEVRCDGKPLAEALVEYVRGLKIAARCIVTRGIGGCFETGEVATQSILDLSYNMPLKIVILLPSAQVDQVLPTVEKMVVEGIITVHPIRVLAHKTARRMLPRHFKVRDIMTPSPRQVAESTPLDEVARMLMSSIFTGVPVVDKYYRPVGIVTQGDLIYRGGMPVRLGLLALSDKDRVAEVLQALASKQAREVMTSPAVSVFEDALVTEAVNLMVKKDVKRLPVVDKHGKLTGMLSRLDVFRTIMEESPDWEAFRGQNIQVNNLHVVADIMRRDTVAVQAETPVEEVLRIIDKNDIQRVAVVDEKGKLLGLISDRDLLTAFTDYHPGIWDYFVSWMPFSERDRAKKGLKLHLRLRTAAEVMKTGLITVREDTPIEDSIRLMAEKALKRLPVVDAEGKFKGMISRDALLRVGFGYS
jgi:CBS domain-containing protein